jgi:alkylhydroperoxidase/carboxymuconolactone decarboxylase family protein YurZ
VLGVSEQEILHIIAFVLIAIGFPATKAVVGWAGEVLLKKSDDTYRVSTVVLQ